MVRSADIVIVDDQGVETFIQRLHCPDPTPIETLNEIARGIRQGRYRPRES